MTATGTCAVVREREREDGREREGVPVSDLAGDLSGIYARVSALVGRLGDELPAPCTAGFAVPAAARYTADERTRLLMHAPQLGRVLRPLATPVTLHPWYAEPPTDWLLAFAPGWTATQTAPATPPAEAWQTVIQQYPALARIGGRVPSDAPGYWWELPTTETAPATPTLALLPTSAAACAAVVPAGTVLAAGGVRVPTDDAIVHGVLMSALAWWWLCMSDATPFDTQRVAALPLPAVPPEQWQQVGHAVEQQVAAAQSLAELHTTTVYRVLKDLAPVGAQPVVALQRWWHLDLYSLCGLLAEHYRSDIPVPYRDAWEDWLVGQRRRYTSTSERLAAQQAALDEQVSMLYGLTAAEHAALMVATPRPVYYPASP